MLSWMGAAARQVGTSRKQDHLINTSVVTDGMTESDLYAVHSFIVVRTQTWTQTYERERERERETRKKSIVRSFVRSINRLGCCRTALGNDWVVRWGQRGPFVYLVCAYMSGASQVTLRVERWCWDYEQSRLTITDHIDRRLCIIRNALGCATTIDHYGQADLSSFLLPTLGDKRRVVQHTMCPTGTDQTTGTVSAASGIDSSVSGWWPVSPGRPFSEKFVTRIGLRRLLRGPKQDLCRRRKGR